MSVEVCPRCRARLESPEEEDGRLLCAHCGAAFVMRDGVPLLFPRRVGGLDPESYTLGELVPEVPGARIERCLGQGGLGLTYLAERAGKPLVIKAIYPSLSRSDDFGERLWTGALALMRLELPGVARLLGTHVFAQEEQQVHCLLCEYIEGPSFREWLAADKPDLAALRAALADVAALLAHVHRAGRMHLNLKAENLRMHDGQPRLLDLGHAQLLGERPAELLVRAHVDLGTQAYMAPDLRHPRRKPTAACDLYSLGVLAFEAFSGKIPFDGPWAIRETALPVELQQTIIALLDPDPDARLADASEAARRLRGARPWWRRWF